MGNWRTVNIEGTIDPKEVDKATEFLVYENGDGESWARGCLGFSYALCGLQDWINDSGVIYAIGNLSERDYDNDDIERELTHLARMCPSLELTLHSGSDYESLVCSATFHVKDGVVKRCNPEVEMIKEIPREIMQIRLYRALGV